jgi:hypothetical protein
MRYATGLLLACSLYAADTSPGFFRGTLISADRGFVEVHPVSGAAVRCGFDSHTWIERDRKKLSMAALESGVLVEILTDLRAERCYTRTIRLVDTLTPPVAKPRVPQRNPLLESLFPRGNLTFGGVVLRRSPTVLVLRTRNEPEQTVVLRDDTRFLDSGLPATAEDCTVNTRVFIRAGKNLDNKIEAYQVIWGEIPGPKSSTHR